LLEFAGLVVVGLAGALVEGRRRGGRGGIVGGGGVLAGGQESQQEQEGAAHKEGLSFRIFDFP